MPPLYPVFLNLQGRPCLVVGGGAVAERKVHGLLAAEARVTVVSPAATDALRTLAERGAIRWLARPFEPDDVSGMALVVAATNRPEVNARVSEAAQRHGVWVNVVDQPERCTFFVPSVVRRGDLVLAVSTGGASPSLARRIRRELEARYGDAYAGYVANLAALRAYVQDRVADEATRRALLARFADDPWRAAALAEDADAWLARAKACVDAELGPAGERVPADAAEVARDAENGG
ncbi:precorrin-2 dehydrogenase/sirohydrochlorin ferrochelatase family protein [Calditerricola satsumensis]|uniref:precorrin-2 dehydrogenase n=1 Tax=Calditerricola satsumensis TaxID=373054 RepID=A0A8J3B8G8_9BACI|nr:bifunctional precorrin-2 dehydrogenase/sirohydrochlorin ferrochelatase [Calditerricola satsumensis]GGK00975.1 precorrin-2 dehydrogenase [Calditerricola satsumensis]